MALVAALWGATILAVVTMSVLELTRADSRLVGGGAAEAELQAIADAAINITILAMLGPPATRPPVNATPFAVTFEGSQVRMVIQDEAGKVDINRAGVPVLRLMLAGAGFDTAAAEALAARIVARRSAGPDGQPPRPFQSLSELRELPGMTAMAYRWLAPAVTVYAQTQYVDPSYAGARVLGVFRAHDRAAAERLRQLEEEAKGLRPPAPGAGVVPGHAYTITAEVAGAGDSRARRLAVIRLTGQPRAPLLVYKWN